MGKTLPPLTRRQKETLDYINAYTLERGYPPSMRDLAHGINLINASTAQYHVEQLKKKGYLTKESKKSRGVILTAPLPTVPLLGYIAAGEPIEPIEDPEPITVPSNIKLKPHFQYYALKIQGDSMKDMGIWNGDTILVQHQLVANNNDIVVAVTEKGATLKVFKQEGGRVRLEPRNKDYKAMYPRRLEIRGIFAGLIPNVTT